MTLFVLDPNLTPKSGHHLDWDMLIAKVAQQRGEKVVIFANSACEAMNSDTAEINPWFKYSCYESRNKNPYIGKFDDFRFYNDVLFEELMRLSHNRFTALDCVFIPTLTEQHLLGYVSWIKTFDKARAPLFVVHLMFPSGVSLSRNRPPELADPQQASFYGLAFQRAAEPGPDIHFFGGGRQIAHEFAELSGLPITAHGVPFCPVKAVRETAPSPSRKVLLYAGDAKENKGFHLVPEVAETLSRLYPDWEVLIHANEGTAWGETRKAFDELKKIAAKAPNIRLMSGRLSREDYDALLQEADAMVSTYDPVQYARKSSGVLWESVSLGLAILAPADCWIAYEAEEWGAGFMTYSPHSAQAICQQFSQFAAKIDALLLQSQKASKLYREFNGPQALFNQFGHLWAARLTAAKLAGQPTLQKLSVENQQGRGLSWNESLDGAIVRWSEREFDIQFDWKFHASWELTIGAPRFIGPEQILKAKAYDEAGGALAVRPHVEAGMGHIVVTGQRVDREQQKVTVALPWTFRPDGEKRELGVLVRDISVGPASGDARPTESNRSPVEIVSRVEWDIPGESFHLAGVVSGRVALDPSLDASVSMKLKTRRGPPLAHAVRLYVNGSPIIVQCAAHDGETWTLEGKMPTTVIMDRSALFRVVGVHCPASYKHTSKHWTRSSFRNQSKVKRAAAD